MLRVAETDRAARARMTERGGPPKVSRTNSGTVRPVRLRTSSPTSHPKVSA
nr:hypothetical protein [Nocardia amikacinitolerans]